MKTTTLCVIARVTWAVAVAATLTVALAPQFIVAAIMTYLFCVTLHMNNTIEICEKLALLEAQVEAQKCSKLPPVSEPDTHIG